MSDIMPITIQRRTQQGTHPNSGQTAFERVLANRGVENKNELDYGLKHLLPPSALSNINEAAVLLAEAVSAGANVVLIGDFDADGATSTALAVRCLKAFGLQSVDYLVPNRFEFGYGLTPEIVGVAATKHPDLIVTVDNGISSVHGVYAAQQLGISVLVTDHHLPGDEIPQADAIVNPNLPGDRFASKNLAGVGVIFYVMSALRAELRALGWFAKAGIPEPNMSQFLDLVALGTVADVVRLDRNNRILVHQGLQRIRNGQSCAGIAALLAVAKRNSKTACSADLGFAVGPRLNAAGRMDDMSLGIECLLSDDADRALQLALQLDEMNQARRGVEQEMQDDARKIVAEISLGGDQKPPIYVLQNEQWHQGVIGLVAARVREQVNRPTIALAPGENGEWKGSARSVDGVHIRDLLARVDALRPTLIQKFGGHAMAAGLSIAGDKLDEFSETLQTVAAELTKDHDWRQVLLSDGELLDEEFCLPLAEQLRLSTPWGQGFPEPLFDNSFIVLESRTVGERHLKLVVQPEGVNTRLDAICFAYFDQYEAPPQDTVQMAYRLDVNEWQGRSKLQLIVEHIVQL